MGIRNAVNYKEDIKNLHNGTSNSIIDIYQKSKSANEEDKIVYGALIEFYMSTKKTMNIMEKAIMTTSLKIKELNWYSKYFKLLGGAVNEENY